MSVHSERATLRGPSVDVAIVGAGVVGASVAWHLAKLGVRKVVLLERGAGPGEGSTGRATGGFRAQYGTDVNVRLSLLARAELLRFREETGVDPGFEQLGYLWLAQNATELSLLRDGLRVQRAAGLLEARLVDAAEIAQLNPYVRSGVGGFAGGAFCPSDGFIKPLEILRGYLKDREVRYGARVVALRREAGRVQSLQLASGESLSAGAFVDAAGAWAGDGFHFRARDGRVLLLQPNPGNASDPFSTAVEPQWLAEVTSIARARVPALVDVAVEPDRAWGGLYEMSPDKHALLGRAPGCENLWLANGSSGHGVMHSPALGLLLAEMIVGRPLSLDVRALRPERFAEGEPNTAPELL